MNLTQFILLRLTRISIKITISTINNIGRLMFPTYKRKLNILFMTIFNVGMRDEKQIRLSRKWHKPRIINGWHRLIKEKLNIYISYYYYYYCYCQYSVYSVMAINIGNGRSDAISIYRLVFRKTGTRLFYQPQIMC